MIDIGADAIDRLTYAGYDYTYIAKDNPANNSGLITSVEIWAQTALTGCRVGTFYTTNGNTLKCRDSVLIGDVEAGEKQTFHSLSLSVEEGDYIGHYYTGGGIDSGAPAGDGLWYVEGEHIDPGDEILYSYYSAASFSLYGTGEEAPPPPVSKRGWWSK